MLQQLGRPIGEPAYRMGTQMATLQNFKVGFQHPRKNRVRITG